MSVPESVVVGLFCLFIVFLVLIILLGAVRLLSAMVGRKAKSGSEGDASAMAQESYETGMPVLSPVNFAAGASDQTDSVNNENAQAASGGGLELVNVDERTAAMIMAIVSHETSIPLEKLYFRSIKAIA